MLGIAADAGAGGALADAGANAAVVLMPRSAVVLTPRSAVVLTPRFAVHMAWGGAGGHTTPRVFLKLPHSRQAAVCAMFSNSTGDFVISPLSGPATCEFRL